MTHKEQLLLLAQGVSNGIFPGAVALNGDAQRKHFHQAVGLRMVEPEKRTMLLDTIFDLASLTKPLVIGTLSLQLAAEGQLEFFEPVYRYLPEVVHQRIQIVDLLTHTSGYPAWQAIYPPADQPKQSSQKLLARLGSMPLAYETRSQVVYSCLGYILMGKLIERLTGQSLDRLAKNRIFQPLGMIDTTYTPPVSWQLRCAATESRSSAKNRRGNNYPRDDWWQETLIGSVHDENAHYLGGISGNAGLFSTADDLSLYCRSILSRDERILPVSAISDMAFSRTEGLNANRSIGWVVLKDGSLYHNGFTGTALRLNLEQENYQILLTNRVHPNADDNRILGFRDQFFGF